MLELDETTRRALSQRYGPTPDAQARVLTGLRSTLGGPHGPDAGGGGEGALPTGGSPAGTGQAVWIAKICAATTGLTGAGLLVLKLGATVLTSFDERDPTEALPEVEVTTSAREPPPAPTAPEPSTGLDAPSKVSSPVPIQTPTTRRSSTTGSTLAAELALLDGAKRILSSDPEAALVRLEQHRQEFPTGVLAPEREALRVDVLCALGRMPAAKCDGTGSGKGGD
jgi:hypothetical protein